MQFSILIKIIVDVFDTFFACDSFAGCIKEVSFARGKGMPAGNKDSVSVSIIVVISVAEKFAVIKISLRFGSKVIFFATYLVHTTPAVTCFIEVVSFFVNAEKLTFGDLLVFVLVHPVGSVSNKLS